MFIYLDNRGPTRWVRACVLRQRTKKGWQGGRDRAGQTGYAPLWLAGVNNKTRHIYLGCTCPVAISCALSKVAKWYNSVQEENDTGHGQ